MFVQQPQEMVYPVAQQPAIQQMVAQPAVAQYAQPMMAQQYVMEQTVPQQYVAAPQQVFVIFPDLSGSLVACLALRFFSAVLT